MYVQRGRLLQLKALAKSGILFQVPFEYPGYALGDLNSSQRLSNAIDGVLQIQNLANRYQDDAGASSASMGRQIKLGARVRL
jgi:hypothetical protein